MFASYSLCAVAAQLARAVKRVYISEERKPAAAAAADSEADTPRSALLDFTFTHAVGALSFL